MRNQAADYHRTHRSECNKRPCRHDDAVRRSIRVVRDALRDGFKKLPRTDSDIVSAQEHLANFYFEVRQYRYAEIYFREVIGTRTKATPPDAKGLLAARQSLVSVLLKGMRHDPEAMLKKLEAKGINLNKREAKDVYVKAVDLSVKNVNAPDNTQVQDDIDLGLQSCNELVCHNLKTKTHKWLLMEKVKQMAEQSDGKGPPTMELIEARRSLMRFHVERLSQRKQGFAVYQEILSAIASHLDAQNDEGCTYREIQDSIKESWDNSLEILAKKRWRKVITYLLARVRMSMAAAKSSAIEPEIGEEDVLFDAQLPSGDGSASAKWVQDFIKFRKATLAPFDADLTERVRVTIIDTGLDDTHPYIGGTSWQKFRGKTPLFKDFTLKPGEGDGTEATPIDQDGHGTFIAGLVLQLAPDVELSIARIGKTRLSLRRDADLSRRIAEAIKYAAKTWKTNIISMSFGLPSFSRDVKGAIDEALYKNVILLGAAGNTGNLQQVAYPARVDRVVKIFAADSFGRGVSFSPDVLKNREYSFSILGCDVESIWPAGLKAAGERDGLAWTKRYKGDGELWTRMSGTSFSTPIAAALVAVIYQFHDTNKATIDLHPQLMGLKTVSSVKAILWKMSHTSKWDNYNFLNPTNGREGWFYFQKGGGENRVSFFGRKLGQAILSAEQGFV